MGTDGNFDLILTFLFFVICVSVAVLIILNALPLENNHWSLCDLRGRSKALMNNNEAKFQKATLIVPHCISFCEKQDVSRKCKASERSDTYNTDNTALTKTTNYHPVSSQMTHHTQKLCFAVFYHVRSCYLNVNCNDLNFNNTPTLPHLWNWITVSLITHLYNTEWCFCEHQHINRCRQNVDGIMEVI